MYVPSYGGSALQQAHLRPAVGSDRHSCGCATRGVREADKRTPGEDSATVRERVAMARTVQADRFRGTKLHTNTDMGAAEVLQFCQIDAAGQSLMRAAMRQLQLSARAYHRVLKPAQTIADLAGVAEIGPAHLTEALQYRPRRAE